MKLAFLLQFISQWQTFTSHVIRLAEQCQCQPITIFVYCTTVHSGPQMNTRVHNCTLESATVHSGPPLYTRVHHCTLRSATIHSGPPLYTRIRHCTLGSTTVHSGPPLYTRVYHCTLGCATVHSVHHCTLGKSKHQSVQQKIISITIKILDTQNPEKFAVIILKFK